MSLENSSHPDRPGLDELVPSRYALRVGDIDVLVVSDGVFAVPSDKPVRTAAFTSSYGVRSDPFQGRAAMHAGIDLAGPIGTPIYATADGMVETAGWNSGGYGNLVELDHGGGVTTRYAHLSGYTVTPGQQVPACALLGYQGSTGNSTGVHLHFEVRPGGAPVAPVPWLTSRGVDLHATTAG